jgi:hypothetical protein
VWDEEGEKMLRGRKGRERRQRERERYFFKRIFNISIVANIQSKTGFGL